MATLDACLNIADLRKQARRTLPLPVFAFLDGGAEDEVTMARNRASFRDWALQPRSFVDVSAVTASTSVLGCRLDWPFMVAPTGLPGLLHPAGEAAIAKAAERVGAMYCHSTMASQSIENVASATDGPKAFQLYLFKDRGITRELLQRARAASFDALILTIDVQIPANRERDKRTGMTLPPRFGLRSLLEFAKRPAWSLNALRQPIRLANFEGHRANPGITLLNYINEQFDPSIEWHDLEWVAREWNGPLAVKGVLSPQDAARAIQAGATCVILSNHGGRQLDAGVSPMDVLEETVGEVDGSGEIVVDGGIRRGTDMLKAIALGAKACMSGRVGLYGLAAAGAAGAERALTLLRDEFRRDLALLGTPSVEAIDRQCVRRVPSG